MDGVSVKGGARRSMGLAGSPVRFAASPIARARGLLAQGAFEGVLLLAPCKDIHTAGMRAPIDVAFIDEKGLVLESHRRVGPFRRLRNADAACVAERVSLCEEPWFGEGDRLMIASAPSGEEVAAR